MNDLILIPNLSVLKKRNVKRLSVSKYIDFLMR